MNWIFDPELNSTIYLTYLTELYSHYSSTFHLFMILIEIYLICVLSP